MYVLKNYDNVDVTIKMKHLNAHFQLIQVGSSALYISQHLAANDSTAHVQYTRPQKLRKQDNKFDFFSLKKRLSTNHSFINTWIYTISIQRGVLKGESENTKLSNKMRWK